jgi:chromosome segregation ATPase
MPPTQADMDFGLYMYANQMLPEEIEQAEEFIREHRLYIQDCDDEIKELQEKLKGSTDGKVNVGEQQAKEWRDRIASLQKEKKGYEDNIRVTQKEGSDLEQQRREATGDE